MTIFCASYREVSKARWQRERERTVFTLTRSEHREDGRLTKQFFRLWTRDTSAGVAWLLRLLESGAMVRVWQERMRKDRQ
jgi:hypothetical protein